MKVGSEYLQLGMQYPCKQESRVATYNNEDRETGQVKPVMTDTQGKLLEMLTSFSHRLEQLETTITEKKKVTNLL